MNNNKKNNKNNRSSYSLPIGMCIGLAIGTAVGAATHNIGTWLPIGLCLGLALGCKDTEHHGDDANGKQQVSPSDFRSGMSAAGTLKTPGGLILSV